MSANRAARRRAMRYADNKHQRMMEQMTINRINERLLQQGISQEDLDKARDEGREKGFTEGVHVTCLCTYAAAIRVLKRDYGFTNDQLIDFLGEMDLMSMTVMEHQEMVQETLEETGIALSLDEGVDRVTKKEKKPILCPTCLMGDPVSSGAYDCDAIDGLTAGKTECKHYKNREE